MILRKDQHAPTSRKVIFLVTEDWYFISHRLPLARALRQAGWEVVVATQVNRPEDAAAIESSGLRLVHLPVERSRMGTPRDLVYLWRAFRLYRRERPQVVHHVAMKPVLYGSIAARAAGIRGTVNALAGLGYLFTSSSGRARLARGIVTNCFRALFGHERTRLILQNAQDMDLFQRLVRVPSRNLRLIRGAGVDLDVFQPSGDSCRPEPVVVMVSRMLRDKGVAEFVAAARELRRDGVRARFLLVGGIDARNPNSFTQQELLAFEVSGVIEWHDHQKDIAVIYAAADIAVLPSYREGLPKSLLEAAACGLPIVTTDTSGCREVVTDGLNGFLVPVRTVAPLALALRRLISDPELRRQMGARSRERAEREFGEDQINRQVADVYAELSEAR